MGVTTYDMDELERLTGVNARTIRHWMGQRLLAKPRGSGRGSAYDERHLRRVRAIKALRAEGHSLASIRVRLTGLDESALEKLATSVAAPTSPTTVPEPPPEPTFPSALCEIVELMDGLALMIDRSKGMLVRRVAADIYRHYSHRR